MKRVGSLRELRVFLRDWFWSLVVGVLVSQMLFSRLRRAPKPPPPAPPTDQVDALRYAMEAQTEQVRRQLEQLLGQPVRLVGTCPCPRCTEQRKGRAN